MKQVFILALVSVTSLGAYLIGAKGLKLPGRGIRKAIGKMLECLGITLVFLVLNIGLGVVTILATRVLTGGFVSMYRAADGTLLVLSLIQGLVFQWWRDLSAPWPPDLSRQQ
ncbi:MAG: hypothetical protein ACE5MG_05755 [Candidatus Methylomirabilales bacterium]